MNMRPDLLRLREPLAQTATIPTPFTPFEAAPLHDARVLTKGGVQARIALDGQVYALRITRAGKLILTK
jgi:hemin uptake protein HemP